MAKLYEINDVIPVFVLNNNDIITVKESNSKYLVDTCYNCYFWKKFKPGIDKYGNSYNTCKSFVKNVYKIYVPTTSPVEGKNDIDCNGIYFKDITNEL